MVEFSNSGLLSRIRLIYTTVFFCARRESGLRPSRANALGPLNAGEAWIQSRLAVDGMKCNNTNINLCLMKRQRRIHMQDRMLRCFIIMFEFARLAGATSFQTWID